VLGDHEQRVLSRPGAVVVAVGHDTSGQAQDWAAAEASARGCRLHVVHAERLRSAVDPSGLVPVATRLSIADPAAALIRESEGAALVVVGSRARGAVSGRLFGSASGRVAERAPCPVVVRTGKATADEHAESGRRTAVPGADPIGIEQVHRPRRPWE
jgi:hypothetical protein